MALISLAWESVELAAVGAGVEAVVDELELPPPPPNFKTSTRIIMAKIVVITPARINIIFVFFHHILRLIFFALTLNWIAFDK